MAHFTKVCIDIGSQESKGLLEGEDRRQYRRNITTLGLLGGNNSLPGAHLSCLEFPVKGIYDERSAASGAHFIRNGDIYIMPEYKLFAFGLLADLLEAAEAPAGEVEIDFAVFGFPCSHLSRAEDVKKMFAEPVPVQKTGGRKWIITVKQILTESQPYFAVVDQIAQFKGHDLRFDRGETLFANGPVMVYHGGSNSNDFAFIPQTLTNAAWDTVTVGTFQLLSAVKALVYRKTARSITDEEAMQVYKTGRYWYKQEYDFNDDLIPLVSDYFARDVKGPLALFIANNPQAYSLLLVGGGPLRSEPDIKRHFAELFRGGVHLCVDDMGQVEPVYSVLRWMHKKATIEAAKGGHYAA